eukprot:766312-Hanusia_phi.AAC.4
MVGSSALLSQHEELSDDHAGPGRRFEPGAREEVKWISLMQKDCASRALNRARTDDLRLIRATRYQLRYESLHNYEMLAFIESQ